MLGKMVCCTVVVPRLTATLEAWQRWLDYRLIARGYVSAEQARVWGADAMAGHASAVLLAASGEAPCVRLIESPPTPGYAPVRCFGWNAVEILVTDPYVLADRLAGSPFEVVIPPRPIPYDPRIHAMQALGPGGELLYLTQLPSADPPLGLSPARTPVDRPFITILGGPSLEGMRRYYSDTFGNATTSAGPTQVRILNDRFGLAADHGTPLGIVTLARGFLLELDEYPAAAVARPRRAGELPPGIAMVSFELPEPAWAALACREAPTRLFEPPYDGARVGVVEGAAGEWIELVERE